MTTREKVRIKYPGAIVSDRSGEYVVLNLCWSPVRALLFEDEAAARELVRAGRCNAPQCRGAHEVRHVPPDSMGDWHD